MIKININLKTSFGPGEDWLKDKAKKIFNLLKKTGDYEFEINVIGLKKIKALNKKFRNKNTATTILSFVSSESKDCFIEAPSKYEYLGEIFLCPKEIEKQAKKIKISTKRQVTRILAHGILHLVGYRHDTDNKRIKMEKKEQNILEALNSKN